MGLLDSLSAVFGGSSSQVGAPAAAQSSRFIKQAIEELRGQQAPFAAAGELALPEVIQGISAGGLGERLSEIFGTDVFEDLVGERTRAVEGQLAAGGLTRSGTAISEAAAIPTDIGLALESLLTGRATDLAFGAQGAGAQTSANIANLLTRQGADVASGILTDAQARAAGGQNLVNLATTAAGIFFSDPVLKENVEQISHIGDLALYEWDWIPETKDTMIAKYGTTGFMADEVLEKYPHHVSEFCGFLVIDYPSLLDELEAAPWLN